MPDTTINNQPNNQTKDTSQDVCIATMAIEIKNIKEKLDKMPTLDEMKLAISAGIKEALKDCDDKYATIKQVSTLERIIYGAVGAILLAFMSGLIYLVFK